MKRIFAIVICAILLTCVLPVATFAEGDSLDVIEQGDTVTESLPTAEEVATEDTETTADLVLDYAKEHFEEISVIITLISMVFYQMRKHSLLNKTIGTLNNNAVTIAENSKTEIQNVTGYKEIIENLLAEFRSNAEEKQMLEKTLAEVQTFLKTAKLANVELANEVAELLVLANIPNAKKEELYSRHLAAVGAIADAEKTEVIADDNGKEAE